MYVSVSNWLRMYESDSNVPRGTNITGDVSDRV